jgi:hypothetical protein
MNNKQKLAALYAISEQLESAASSLRKAAAHLDVIGRLDTQFVESASRIDALFVKVDDSSVVKIVDREIERLELEMSGEAPLEATK